MEVKVCFVADFILKMLLTGWRHLAMSIKQKVVVITFSFILAMPLNVAHRSQHSQALITVH